MFALAGYKILGTFEHHAEFFEIFKAQRRNTPSRQNSLNTAHADARYSKQFFLCCAVYFEREQLHVIERPVAFRVYIGVQKRMLFIEQFICVEAVKAQKPVGLI